MTSLLLRCIGRYWHLADNRGTATFCPLLGNSGHRSVARYGAIWVARFARQA
jgi:hypothetical protein